MSSRHGRTQVIAASAIGRALILLLMAGGWAPATGNPATRAQPPDEIAGVRLGDSFAHVQSTLASIGSLEVERRGQGGAKQVWQLRSGPFRQLMLRFDATYQVAYLTAYVDAQAPPVRFDAIGPLETARAVGQYFYMWYVASATGAPGHIVQAQGVEREHLVALSLYPAGSHQAAAPEEARPAQAGSLAGFP